jgi:DNA polymerase-1
LQNIPARTKDGKEIRKVFVAPPGHALVAADYSQIELRILAHFSQDPVLIAAFNNDEDIHAAVAAKMKGVHISEVTEQMRKFCKNLNFGIVYGEGAKKLAGQLDITVPDAKEFIAHYFKTYPTIKKLRANVVAACRQQGYVQTILGRRRYIPNINEPDGPDRWTAEREAFNTLIQGSAADLIKLAMLECYKNLDAKMLLQVHDELVFEIPLIALDAICEQLNTIMTSVIPLSVPLKVDIEYGPSWGEMVAYESNTNDGSLRLLP